MTRKSKKKQRKTQIHQERNKTDTPSVIQKSKVFESNVQFLKNISLVTLEELKSNWTQCIKCQAGNSLKPHGRIIRLHENEQYLIEGSPHFETKVQSSNQSPLPPNSFPLSKIKKLIIGRKLNEIDRLHDSLMKKSSHLMQYQQHVQQQQQQHQQQQQQLQFTSLYCLSFVFNLEGGIKELDLLFPDEHIQEYNKWCSVLHYLVIDKKKVYAPCCKLTGNGIYGGIAGKLCNFTIQQYDACSKSVEQSQEKDFNHNQWIIEVLSEDPDRVEVEDYKLVTRGDIKTANDDGDDDNFNSSYLPNLSASYIMQKSGKYLLDVKQIQSETKEYLRPLGSPFTICILPGDISIENTIFQFLDVKKFKGRVDQREMLAGDNIHFKLVFTDKFGNHIQHDLSKILQINVTCLDNGEILLSKEQLSLRFQNHSYFGTFQLYKSGVYEIRILLSGKTIPIRYSESRFNIIANFKRIGSMNVIKNCLTEPKDFISAKIGLMDQYDNKILPCNINNGGNCIQPLFVEVKECTWDVERIWNENRGYIEKFKDHFRKNLISFVTKIDNKDGCFIIHSKSTHLFRGSYLLLIKPGFRANILPMDLQISSIVESMQNDKDFEIYSQLMQRFIEGEQRKELEQIERFKMETEKQVMEEVRNWTRGLTFREMINEVRHRFSTEKSHSVMSPMFVAKGATTEEILKAYKKVLFLIHPDRQGLGISTRKYFECNIVFNELEKSHERFLKVRKHKK